jgi:hypothetical protein
MPIYEVEAGGETFEVDAPDIKRAESSARLFVARSRMTKAAEKGAAERLPEKQPLGGEGGVSSIFRRSEMGESGPPARGSAIMVPLSTIAGAGTVGQLIRAPVATGTALLTGAGGAKVGKGLGREAGSLAETLGAPTGTAAVLGAGGEIAGGLVGGIGGVKALQKLSTLAATPAERAVIETIAKRALAGEAAPAAQATAAASPGAARAAGHKQVMEFAKEAAKKRKLGEKIWMELDEAGAPVRVLTPDQAGAAARAGKATTWVKNLWM